MSIKGQLSKRVTGAMFLSLFLATLLSANLFFAIGRASAIAAQSVASLTNEQRAAAGLSALAWNGALASSAVAKANDICAKGYWAHTSPDGVTPWQLISQAGYSFAAAGENLAKGFNDDGALVAGWMASPAHRANIINSEFADIGVGIANCTLDGASNTVVVAHYGKSLASAKSAAASAPKPAVKTPSPAPAKVQAAAAPAPAPAEETKPVEQVQPATTQQPAGAAEKPASSGILARFLQLLSTLLAGSMSARSPV